MTVNEKRLDGTSVIDGTDNPITLKGSLTPTGGRLVDWALMPSQPIDGGLSLN